MRVFIFIVSFFIFDFIKYDGTNNNNFSFISSYDCGGSCFLLKNFPSDSINIKVFNRWGDKVYANTIYEKNWIWNGYTNDNLKLPQGVYIYIFNNNLIDTTGSLEIR